MEKGLKSSLRYVQINSVSYGSTGNVMFQVARYRESLGDECWCMWGRGRKAVNEFEYAFGRKIGFPIDVLQTFVDGRAGFHSKLATNRVIARLEEIDPDVVHLHNLHGYFINVGLLFRWLHSHRCKVVWTLHDCWAFTGHCAYFSFANCDEWRSGCTGDCPQLRAYPPTFSKASCVWNYRNKQKLFTSLPIDKMTIVTPSNWLAGLAKQSFLGRYNIEVRNNVVDTSVFHRVSSNIRQRLGLTGRRVVLGVASPWNQRKGLDDFIYLANELNHNYAIILVGLTKNQMRKTVKSLQKTNCAKKLRTKNNSQIAKATVTTLGNGVTIVMIERTDTQELLVELYSCADVFFNPSYEDNYPTVLLEARACGSAIVTYNSGGCVEAAGEEAFVAQDRYDASRLIQSLCDSKNDENA